MRILIISPFYAPNIGGQETHLNDLCKGLIKHGHKVQVLTYRPLTTPVDNYIPREKTANLHIRRIPWLSGDYFFRFMENSTLKFLYLTPGLLLYTFYFLLRHRRDFDVIHGHGLVAAFICRLLSYFFSIRTVISVHSIFNFKENRILSAIIGWALKRADQVFCLADSSRRDLEATGFNPQKITFVPQWVDQAHFKPLDKIECRRSLNLPEQYSVLFVGRLYDGKGVLELLDAFKALKDEPVQLILVGDGPLKGQAVSAAATHDNIHYAGPQMGQALVEYYNAADLVAVVSRIEEGFSRVILEALSCGTPVLVSRRGCLPEMVDERVSLLTEPDSDAIREAVTGLLNNPDTCATLQRNSRPYAEARFSEKNVLQIISVYEGKSPPP